MCRYPALMIGQRGEPWRAGNAVASGPDTWLARLQCRAGDDAGGIVGHAGSLQTEVFNLRCASGGNQDLVRLDLEASPVTVSDDPLAVSRRRDGLHGDAGLDANPLLRQESAQHVDQLGLFEGQEPRVPTQHRNLDPEPGKDLSKLDGDC